MREGEVKLTIQGNGSFQLEKGKTVYEILKQNGLFDTSHCGGNGTCGRCAVRFLTGTPLPKPHERRCFSPEQLRDGWRLACVAKPMSDCALEWEVPREKGFILTEHMGTESEAQAGSAGMIQTGSVSEISSGSVSGAHSGSASEVHFGNSVNRNCAKAEQNTKNRFEQTDRAENYDVNVAEKNDLEKAADRHAADVIAICDLGTTTIVLQLLEKSSQRVIDTIAVMNPQRRFGADVLTRMQRALEGEAKGLAGCVRSVIEEGLKKWLAEGYQPERMCISGNTVMVHLLMGYDVSRLAVYPFEPVTTGEIHFEIGGIPAVILPGFSAFVGGDLMAGAFVCKRDMAERKLRTTLLIDLGTNGEMILFHEGKLYVSATAAGPAFEGGAGAAVMGSDMIKIAAGLLADGVMDESGLLADAYFEAGVSVDGIHLTQQDIRGLQMAKASVRAGIQILLSKADITEEKVETVYLAGGFGYKVDVSSAERIGLLPKGLSDRTQAVGNSSLAGALLYALDDRSAEYAERLKAAATVINLAEQPEFENFYINAMSFKN